MHGTHEGSAQNGTGGQLHVLLVAAIPRTFGLDRAALRQHDIRVLSAPPRPETLNLLQREPVSLVVIEIEEDSRAAEDLCRNLRSLPFTDDIPVLLLARPEKEADARGWGADGVLPFPSSGRGFLEAVWRYAVPCERRHPRYRVSLRFAFSGEGRTGQALSRVVSLGGAFLNTDVPMPRGARLRLSFRVPDDDDADIRCTAVVRNTPGWIDAAGRPAGFGVRFEDLGDEERRRLQVFLESLEGGSWPGG